MAATQISCRGYDPENMHWTTVHPAETAGPDSARFRSAALNAAVLRRAQDQALKPASVDAAGVHAGNQQSPAPRAAGRSRRLLTKWKPPVIPKPAPDDYVVVIKPRTRVSLYETFQETGYGRVFTALLGAQPATDLTIIPPTQAERGRKSKRNRRKRGKRRPDKLKAKAADQAMDQPVNSSTGSQGKPPAAPPPPQAGAEKPLGPPQNGGSKTWATVVKQHSQ
ncbi:hypothetical protein V5799_017083, partial [Amblyomma americanum]